MATDDLWPEARYLLAEAYEASGNLRARPSRVYSGRRSAPDDPAAQLEGGRLPAAAPTLRGREARAARVVAAAPANVDARIALGNALAGLRDFDGALKELNEAVRLEPKRSEAYVSLGRLKVTQGQRDAAKVAFEQAVRSDDRSVPARHALADFQWAQGDQKTAEATLTQALAIDPNDLTTNRALATFYLETKQTAKAEPYLRTLATLSKTPQAQLGLADFYIAHERPDEARVVLDSLQQQGAVAVSARTRLAEIEYRAGRRDAAHQMIEALLTEQPNAAEAQLAAARWSLDEGRPDDALERAKVAIAVNNRLAAAYYIRGVARRVHAALRKRSNRSPKCCG